jgi:hypothetical protein
MSSQESRNITVCETVHVLLLISNWPIIIFMQSYLLEGHCPCALISPFVSNLSTQMSGELVNLERIKILDIMERHLYLRLICPLSNWLAIVSFKRIYSNAASQIRDEV